MGRDNDIVLFMPHESPNRRVKPVEDLIGSVKEAKEITLHPLPIFEADTKKEFDNWADNVAKKVIFPYFRTEETFWVQVITS